jgi:hypothetical protein
MAFSKARRVMTSRAWMSFLGAGAGVILTPPCAFHS